MFNISINHYFTFLNFSNLKLEHEFDRRVEEFHFQSNGTENDEERFNVIPVRQKKHLPMHFFSSLI